MIKDSTFIRHSLKGHSDQVITAIPSPDSPSLIASSSADNTLRLWDLRQGVSVKLFRSPAITDMQNILFKGDHLLVSNGNNILAFDQRASGIIVQNHTIESEQIQADINQIAISQDGKWVGSIDDEGQVTLYSGLNLKKEGVLQGCHTNIGYTLDFIQQKTGPTLISGGFDSHIRYWDINKDKCKAVNLAELAQTYIQGQLLCPPLVYSVCSLNNMSLVSCETGHIFGINIKEPKKPKFIIDGHLAKVIRSVFMKGVPDKMLSVSNDQSFAIWDLQKRDQHHNPSFIKRVSIDGLPNWMDTTLDHKVVVATTSSLLSVYSPKA